MVRKLLPLALLMTLFTLPLLSLTSQVTENPYTQISFKSEDGLEITADLYAPHPPKAPFIVLFHQADFSRGEYREIAPKLNALGFNCLAVDQRSGKISNSVVNQTNKKALEENKKTTFLDALPDMRASIAYVKANHAQGKLILWGSSYSSALVLKIAGDEPRIADGVVSFSPGEYFADLGTSETYITQAAKNITMAVFVTSGKNEAKSWAEIFSAIPSANKKSFIPQTAGRHGARALWAQYPDSKAYWEALTSFLKQFI